MPNRVVLDRTAILSPFGDINHTVNRLLEGKSAIVPGPVFGLPVACASFADTSFRHLEKASSFLGTKVGLDSVDDSETVFLYAAAKGDIRSLEHPETEHEPALLPTLDEQARCIEKIWGKSFARVISVSGACASGALAVEVACELLYDGCARNAVIFGFDVISEFVVSGFHALNALSPEGARPFDFSRDGLTPGEGAAVVVLSLREPRDGEIVIGGAASTNDANHRTGPSRSGEGLFRAASAACTESGVEHGMIGAVKCHGTGTLYNDAMEAKALHSIFPEGLPPCSSVKGALGHTSGGGSLLELLLGAEFLLQRRLPPTARFCSPGTEEPLPLSTKSVPIERPSLLCLSAGFGGINAAVVLEQTT